MPRDQKILYLTFDDGPTPEITQWTLDLLKTYNAKATFFCIGNNIEKHPEIFKNLLLDGHAVGNHTFHHPRGWSTTSDAYVEEVMKTQEVIDFQRSNLRSQIPNSKSQKSTIDQFGSSTINNPQPARTEQVSSGGSPIDNPQSPIINLFRPPYGQITNTQGKRLLALGYNIIMWDILAFDWKEDVSEEQCAQNVISKASEGSIVVFHDSVKASKRMKPALTKTLEHFSQQGYQFEAL